MLSRSAYHKMSRALLISLSAAMFAGALAESTPETNDLNSIDWKTAYDLGIAKIEAGKFKGAEKYLSIARTLALKDTKNPDKYLTTLEQLAAAREARGHYWKAYQTCQELAEALQKSGPAQGMVRLGKTLTQLGRIDYLLTNLQQAQDELIVAAEMFARLPKRSCNEAQTLCELSRVDLDLGELDSAKSKAQAARKISESLAKPDDISTSQCLLRQARCELLLGQPALAERLIAEAIVAASHTKSRQATLTRAECLETCAQIYLNENRLGDALAVEQEAVAIRQDLCGQNHPLTADALGNLATISIAQKNFSDAHAYLDQALEIMTDQFELDSPQIAKFRKIQGDCAMAEGKPEEAKICFSKSQEALSKQFRRHNVHLNGFEDLNRSCAEVSEGFWATLWGKVRGILDSNSQLLDPQDRNNKGLGQLFSNNNSMVKDDPSNHTTTGTFKLDPKTIWVTAVIVIPMLLAMAITMIKSFLGMVRNNSNGEQTVSSAATQSASEQKITSSSSGLRNRFVDPSNQVNRLWDIDE